MNFPEYWLYWTYQSYQNDLASPLRTTCGKVIEILETGRLNNGDGPDFENAFLSIGGVHTRGDVEFHLSARDWYRHGHDQDTRYQRVILHILWDVPPAIPAALSRRFPHFLIRPHLNTSETSWQQKMRTLNNPTSINHSKTTLQELAQLTPQCLASYAEQRFQRKQDRYHHWSQVFSLEDVLYIALAEVLGYGRNKSPFRQLLWAQPPSKMRHYVITRRQSALALWVFLAMRSGLLTNLHFERTFSQSIAATHFQAFHRQGIYPVLQLHDWRFSRSRPTNHPLLRQALLAELLHRYSTTHLFSTLLDIAMARESYQKTLSTWQQILNIPPTPQLAEAVQAFLGLKKCPKSWIGPQRIRQFCLNALLPILHLWASRTGNNGFRLYLEGFYEAFPFPEQNRVLEKGLSVIPDAAFAGLIRRSAFYQQGLLEILS